MINGWLVATQIRPGISIDNCLSGVRTSNQMTATLINELTRGATELTIDQVIVDMDTVPDNDLFAALRPQASTAGVTDIVALIAKKPQPCKYSGFELHRIGGAQSSRNIHAAIYDAFRLCHMS